MQSLSVNWFIEGSIDFEHKKYLILSYLQDINKHFHKSRLYPNLSDLIFHYNNLLSFKKNKSMLAEAFPQRITKADLEAVRLTYEKMITDNELMQQIEDIISYSLHKIDPALREGKEIYDFVESRINICPVGVVPLIANCGYFILRNGEEKKNLVYEYKITIFESKDDKYRGINTQFVTDYSASLINTPESIKIQLISHRKHLPNPAVYSVESDMTFPLEQTLLPVAKQSLVKFISKAA